MRTLFQIGEELTALAELMEELGGEITDDQVGLELEAYFDSLNEDKEAKLERYCWLVKEFEARAESRQQESYRLADLAQQDGRNAKRLKERLKSFLETQNPKKAETRSFKMWVQKNSATPLEYPEAWDAEPASSPERYHETKIILNKKLLRADLEAGELVEGCEIGPAGNHLRIK